MNWCKMCARKNSEQCNNCLGDGSNPEHKPTKFVPLIETSYGGQMPTIEPLNKYKKIGESIGSLVDEKNRAYGDSFNKAGDFLKLLYPNGVQPDQYGDMLGLVRVFDKQMRIATDKDALGENPWRDIGGYAILKSEGERK